MGICQQKWLTTLSLGLIFSCSSAVNAQVTPVGTVSYEPEFFADNDAPTFIGDFFGEDVVTLGYEFSVMPDFTDNNLEMSAFGVFAPPNDPTNPTNIYSNPFVRGGGLPDINFFTLPEQDFVVVPNTVHEIGLWETNSDGQPIDENGMIVPVTDAEPIRRITLEPLIDDPADPGTDIPNPLLGFIDGFAYLALDDPDDPVTPDNELDDIFTLSGSEQFFRLGITYIDNSDQAWINNNSAPFLGDVVVPNANLDDVPNEGAALDPMVELTPNIDGTDQPQGYYGRSSDPTTDPLAFPDQEVLPFFGTNPFFVAGNILFGPLPPSFPIASTTTGTGGTTTGGTTTGGTTTGGTTTGGTTTGGTTTGTGGTTTGGTTTGGTTTGTGGTTTGTGGTTTGGTTTGTGGTTTGGVPTIPEPSLINGLLAMALGGIVTRYRQGKVGK